MRTRNLALVIGLLLALSVVLLGCGRSEEEAVRDSIKGFTAAYNDGDYDKCVEYFEGVDDSNREEALSTLGVARAVVESIEVKSIDNIAIEESTATAEITATATMSSMLGGQSADETVNMTLTKSDGRWKFDFNALAQEILSGLTSMLS